MGNICHSGVKFNELVAAAVKPNFPTQGANGNLHLTAWHKSPRRAKRATAEGGSERRQEGRKRGSCCECKTARATFIAHKNGMLKKKKEFPFPLRCVCKNYI